MTNKRISVLLSLCLFGGAVAWAQCPTIPFCKFSYTLGSDGYSVHFEGETSCEGNLVLSWDFGDGATDVSSGANLNLEPAHIYASEGKYVVRMTVSLPAPNSACKHTHTEVIEIEGGSPDYLTATLDGPTLAAECQQVIFSTYAVGGVPPYTYSWDLGPDYCSPGCPNPLGCTDPRERTDAASISATYAPGHNGSTNNIYVTVTDATNATATCSLELTVKPFFHLPEIFVEGEMNCNNAYGIGSQIMFIPDIVPLSAFEYPTNYFWDFGDGNTYLDNFDGGGFAIHTYTLQAGASYPRPYTVKLTISDPYGSMQATTTIMVCDPNNPNGGGGGNDDDWTLANDANIPTKVIALPGNGLPNWANIRLQNDHPWDCKIINTTRWALSFVDVNVDYTPEVILNTFPGANQVLLSCGGQYIPPHEYYNPMALTLNENGFGVCFGADPGEIDGKYWGCLSVTAADYETNANNPPNNVGNLCHSEINPCLVYIKPSEMTVEVETSGTCRDYSVSAKVEGGGWKKTVINGTTKYVYKEYVWKAIDINNYAQEVDILEPVPGDPSKMQINLDHPYFEQFGPDQYAEFYVKLIVSDHANQSVETTQMIMFNPFRLHVAPEQTRCPGVESQFSNEPIATGGSGDPYTFTWSDPNLLGDNPSFIAPQQGSATYQVTVSDGTSCSLSRSITVTASALDVSGLIGWFTCEGGSNKFLALDDFGGSGQYAYQWSAADPVHLGYLSATNTLNPVVQGFAAGQTITYTITVEDVLGGCTASRDVTVQSWANDLAVTLTGPDNVCARDESELTASGTPVVYGLGAGLMQYHWSTNNRKHDLSGLATNTKVVPITEVVSSYPGTYNYKVRYTNIISGCYAEAERNVTIRQSWQHTGFVPAVRSAVAGDAKPLWDGNDNYFTAGPTGAMTITWAPATPTITEWHNGVPKKGTFVPTPEVPYLTMTVTENATGCSKSFKTNRYFISEAEAELSILSEKAATCVGDEICFDVIFDAMLAGYHTSLLPLSVELLYYFQDADPYPIGSPARTSASKILSMPLQNSSGLYSARICENDFFEVPPGNPSNGEYKLHVEFAPESKPVWNITQFNDIVEEYRVDVYDHPVAGSQSLSRCLPWAAETAIQMNLGIPPCPDGIKVDNQPLTTAARDYIVIHPDAGVEFVPTTTNASNAGRRFLINPCLVPPPAIQQPNPDTSTAVSVTRQTEGVDMVQLSANGLSLEAFPNPFTQHINIRYAFQSGEPASSVTLHLLDYSGRLLQAIHRRQDCPPGEHALEFNGGHLAPGIYLLQITVEDANRLTRKIAKIAY